MILKAEILLDTNDDVDSTIISALIEQVFEDNSHLARMIVCEVKEAVKKHRWEFYANGSFCKDCGAQLGSDYPCR